MAEQNDVDRIVQSFAESELSALDQIGSQDNMVLSPKYTQQKPKPPTTQRAPQVPSSSRNVSQSSIPSHRAPPSPSSSSSGRPGMHSKNSSFGDKFRVFGKRIASGKKDKGPE